MGTFLLVLNFIAFGLLAYLLTRKIRRELDTREIIEKIRDEVNGLIVELNQTTDRNIGIVEERIGRLRSLVEEADKKIQLVDRELQKHDVGIDVYQKLRSSAKQRVDFNPSQDPGHESGSELEIEPETEPETKRTAYSAKEGVRIAGLSLPDSTPATAVEDATIADNTSFKERVLSLARNGFDARIIATRLGTTIGEVELVLSIESGGRE